MRSLRFSVRTKVLTFHFPIIVLFRSRILTGGVPSVAYLSPFLWWRTEGLVLGGLGVDRSDIFVDALTVLSSMYWAVTPGRAHPNLGLITTEVLHVGELHWSRIHSRWFHLVACPLRPVSLSRKTYVQWRHVNPTPSHGLGCQLRWQGPRLWRLEPMCERLRRWVRTSVSIHSANLRAVDRQQRCYLYPLPPKHPHESEFAA